jgi:predicted phosphodiesterase
MNQPLHRLIAKKRWRFVLAGHTHRRMVRRIGDVTFVNAGTLHRQFDPCFCRIDFEAQTVRFVEVDARGRLGQVDERSLL